MHELLATFQRRQRPIFVVGQAARHLLRHGHWGPPGVLELIALAPRSEVRRWPELQLLDDSHKGPIPVALVHEGRACHGSITCVKPGSSERETLSAALARRGFRADALAVDPEGGLWDPHGGWEQAQAGQLLPIDGDLGDLFAGNARNLLALGRLVAEGGFELEPSLLEHAQTHASRVLFAPRSACFRELTAIVCGLEARLGLQYLYDAGLLGLLLPEVHSVVDLHKSSRYHHKDLWEHILQVVEQAQISPLVRWAALLHDVGKCWTRTYGDEGAVHFYQHEELGAILVEGIAARLHIPEAFAQGLAFLVRHHQRPGAYRSEWSDAAVRRLIREAGEWLEPLLQLARADITSAQARRRQESQALAQELARRVAQLREEASRVPPLPTGLGHALLHELQLEAGPRIGRIMRALEASIEAQEIEAHRSPEYYIAFLQSLEELPA